VSDKIVVPEGMLKATEDAISNDASYFDRESIIEAALRWLAENPIVPTHNQTIELCKVFEQKSQGQYCQSIRDVAVEWQKAMFYAPNLDPLVMYIERHFEDSYADKRSLRNRAESAVGDWKEHVKRNSLPKAGDVSFSTGVYFSPKSNDFPVVGFTEPEYPAEVKDYMAWAEVYFGDHPQLSELKNVLSGAYRRGKLAEK
jgi:hypothetical protein